MDIHTFLHAPFEGLGMIAEWVEERGLSSSFTRWHEGEIGLAQLAKHSTDLLVIMGGPMSVYERDRYPWIDAELAIIRERIESGLPTVGICLGAQLIAASLGARVYANEKKEIGWFDLERVSGASASPFEPLVPVRSTVFHWHGDTFDLPRGAVHLERSVLCAHQSFSIGDHVLALQYHLEMGVREINGMIANCDGELRAEGTDRAGLISGAEPGRMTILRARLFGLLNALLGSA